MQQIGITTDGKKVMERVGKFYFEQGLPLCFIYDKMTENNMIPSWIQLVKEMEDNGMTKKRIHHLLHEHVFDSYGKEFRDHVLSTLQKINLL